jgi:uncharacterized membrane protein (UPF0136 family)
VVQKTAGWFIIAFGALLVMLALVAYISSESQISVIMGSGSGLLLILSGLAVLAKNRVGGYVALILIAALTVIFSYRFSMSGKALPAVMAVLSGAMFLIVSLPMARWK